MNKFFAGLVAQWCSCLVVLMIALIILVPSPERRTSPSPSTRARRQCSVLASDLRQLPARPHAQRLRSRPPPDPTRRQTLDRRTRDPRGLRSRSPATLLSAEKSYAFFSGSRPEFNKVLNVREKIANATITGITGQSIEIERDGKHTTVAIGQTVPFDNQTAPGTPPVDAARWPLPPRPSAPRTRLVPCRHASLPAGLPARAECTPPSPATASKGRSRQPRRNSPPHDGKNVNRNSNEPSSPASPSPFATGGLGARFCPARRSAQRNRDPLADPLPVADGAGLRPGRSGATRHRRACRRRSTRPAPVHRARRRHRRGSLQPAVPPRATPRPRPHPSRAPSGSTFQNAQLSDVLNSLSAAAGFIVVQENARHRHDQPQQPAARHPRRGRRRAQQRADRTRDYVALRNGRILKNRPRATVRGNARPAGDRRQRAQSGHSA